MVENTIDQDGIKPFACSVCPSRFTRQVRNCLETSAVQYLCFNLGELEPAHDLGWVDNSLNMVS